MAPSADPVFWRDRKEKTAKEVRKLESWLAEAKDKDEYTACRLEIAAERNATMTVAPRTFGHKRMEPQGKANTRKRLKNAG